MLENKEFSPTTSSFGEDEAPLELGIQMLETMDAPFWWTAAGVVVGATIVASAAYT